nr:uncharacterized protein LOC128671494 [Plodia interpunctella]
MIFVYLFLALSGLSIVSGQNQLMCTTVLYPPYANLNGANQVKIKPMPLPAGLNQYVIRYENRCRVTVALMVKVCDDVAPFVNPVSLKEVDVTRTGNFQHVNGVANAYYLCR